MSIEYDNRSESGTLTCDGIKEGCHGQITLDGSFKEVIDQAKKVGWLPVNSGGEWIHYCPVCGERF